MKRKLTKFLKDIDVEKEILSKERDKIRNMIDDLKDLEEITEEAMDHLTDAADAISKLL